MHRSQTSQEEERDVTRRSTVWEDGRWAPIAIIVTIVLVAVLLGYFFWYAPNASTPGGFAGAPAELEGGTVSSAPARLPAAAGNMAAPAGMRGDRGPMLAGSRPGSK